MGISTLSSSPPTDTHCDIIHAAARAGKATICKDPADMSSALIRDCMAAVAKHNTPFMTAFNRRFDPSFAHLQTKPVFALPRTAFPSGTFSDGLCGETSAIRNRVEDADRTITIDLRSLAGAAFA